MNRRTRIICIAGLAAVAVAALLIVLVALIGGGVIDDRSKKLVIASSSAEFVYDGNAHSYSEWMWVDGEDNLKDGHTVNVVVSGTQTSVGSSSNYLSVTVTDANNADVTDHYDIEYQPGTLEVVPRPITILVSSGNTSGEPLDSSEWSIIYGELLSGHSITMISVGSEVISNNASVVISDRSGNDVSRSYDITVVVAGSGTSTPDTPETLPDDDDDDEDTDDREEEDDDDTDDEEEEDDTDDGEKRTEDTLDTSGGISWGYEEEYVVMEVWCGESTELYLRLMSFGAYEGNSWAAAEEYPGTITYGDAEYSLMYLCSCLLENSGFMAVKVEITNYSSQYFLPYFIKMAEDGGYEVQTGDVMNDGSTEDTYFMWIFLYNAAQDTDGDIYATAWSLGYGEAEEDYRAYVYEVYAETADISPELYEYIEDIIDRNGWRDIDDIYDLIFLVAEYVSGAAEYNPEYDRALDSEEDIVYSFLTEYGEGTCTHFASAATLIFRVLGVPARYTIGYYTYTEADGTVTVMSTDAHAWVEVYIDGFGWVYVETTPGYSSGSGTEKIKINVKPDDVTASYWDGPVGCTSVTGLESFTEAGYTYVFTTDGPATEPGINAVNIVSLVIYDADGNNVTGKIKRYVDFVYETGYVRLYMYELSLQTASAEVYYTGSPVTVAGFVYDSSLTDGNGHTVSFDGVLFDSYRDVGAHPNALADNTGSNIRIYDADGQDITSLYLITVTQGTVTILPREITISASDKTESRSSVSRDDPVKPDADGYTVSCDAGDGIETQITNYEDVVILTINGEVFCVKATPVGSQSSYGRSDITISLEGIWRYDADTGTWEDATQNFSVRTENGRLTVNRG